MYLICKAELVQDTRFGNVKDDMLYHATSSINADNIAIKYLD